MMLYHGSCASWQCGLLGVCALAGAVIVCQAGQTDPMASESLILQSNVTLHDATAATGVALALNDLAQDLEKVLGTAPDVRDTPQADLRVGLDPTIGAAESYRIDVTDQGVVITGADERGAIYGIYRFSREFLGVDPFWFFKDLEPTPCQRLVLPRGTIVSREPTFRYRGWFINDEDLLTEWVGDGGRRPIDYPYYQQVVHPDVIDRVYEALLRSGGNLVIPASFVDVMNPPEARLVRRAAERGLYVTQHHVEPMGVSHFGFENYWKAQGHDYAFAYGSHPEHVRQTWRAYAERWYELAGDKVIWQLGLRGKGDRPIWHDDRSVEEDAAGAIISQAMAEQWNIVQAVDPRPTPPATTTLWAEGSALMAAGSLVVPPDLTIVFSDHGPTQEMQEDFHSTPRDKNRRYGVYYHIGFWRHGAHLLQGATPARVRREFDKIVAKGDTHYAILNVCNVREHVLGIQVAMEMMNDHAGWTESAFWNRFAPEALHEPYQRLLACLLPLDHDRVMQDGAIVASSQAILDRHRKGETPVVTLPPARATARRRWLAKTIATLDTLAADYPADRIPAPQRPFVDVHFLTQAKMLRELYAFYLALLDSDDTPERLADAEAAMERFLAARQAAARGKWADWYRGDRKVNAPALLEQTRQVKRHILGAE